MVIEKRSQKGKNEVQKIYVHPNLYSVVHQTAYLLTAQIFLNRSVHGSLLHLLEVVFRLLSAVDPLMLAKSLILSLNEALNLGPRP